MAWMGKNHTNNRSAGRLYLNNYVLYIIAFVLLCKWLVRKYDYHTDAVVKGLFIDSSYVASNYV